MVRDEYHLDKHKRRPDCQQLMMIYFTNPLIF